MKRYLAIFIICLLGVVLMMREDSRDRPLEPVPDGCLLCHRDMKEPDPSHPVSALGCAACHLGNRYSLDKERAHFGCVQNPGDLRWVHMTCGKAGCHPDITARVKKSVMATNSGMLRIIQEAWLQRGDGKAASSVVKGVHVSDLYGNTPPQNIAIDHYRKMCGGCHLWKKRGNTSEEVGRRGGGCSDCHVVDEEAKKNQPPQMIEHPRLTTRIPSENCTKCHNRSARIGLSYFGRYESAGYGTPYENGQLNSRRLSGNRFYMDLQADVHFRKSGMACIDCHTAVGLMGDGHPYDGMNAQIDITCEACHEPSFSPVETRDSLAGRLAFLNRRVPDVIGGSAGLSRKGTPLYNLQKRGGAVTFYRKLDGLPIEMKASSAKAPHHQLKGHERLSCQACHTAWIPQCYGCHLTYRKSETQYDWISGKASPGRWKEARSYIRFSKPALGVRKDAVVFPISPCQMVVSVLDVQGACQKEESFRVMNLSAFDPHTTAAKSRPCFECHEDPKVMGLGEGILYYTANHLRFRPTHDGPASEMGLSHPLDSYVNVKGNPLQTGLGNGVRPFNKGEIKRILGAAPCLGCHSAYDDPIYRDFEASKKRFDADQGIPCLKQDRQPADPAS